MSSRGFHWAILVNSYVDDILAGADDSGQAIQVRDQLTALLRAGGFELSRWASNDPGLCPQVAGKLLPTADAMAALGIRWDPTADTLALKIALPPLSRVITKRGVLSDVARFFDPLGWAAPALVYAKIFMQDLWLSGYDWDGPLSPDLAVRWTRF